MIPFSERLALEFDTAEGGGQEGEMAFAKLLTWMEAFHTSPFVSYQILMYRTVSFYW